MKKKQLFHIFMIFILFFSCDKINKKSSVKKIVAEWTGKEVKFPAGMECFKMDSLVPCPDINGDNYKILLYIDSAGCTGCRLQLGKWKNLIESADTLFSKKPEFILVFQTKHNGEKEIKQLMRQNGFGYPVFLDVGNSTFTINNFPKEQEYRCFLLDGENKVVMVGNPVLNRGIWELYKKQIAE
jgi:hypothetical protein